MMNKHAGFTLIELLIVVAIIAILAAIAVPNFLEAQTRAKVSRVKADMRSLATAIEAYRIDWNMYPITDQWVTHLSPANFNNRLRGVTTPQSYITSLPVDIFSTFDPVMGVKDDKPTFEYTDWTTAVVGENLPGLSSYQFFNSRDVQNRFFGGPVIEWFMLSAGPDQRNMFEDINNPSEPDTDPEGLGLNQTYDPTNGTISVGDIVRTNAEQRN
jgi:general secretion pathway protein G